MGVHVTAHAIERYRERVRDVPDDEARAALTSPTIVQAAELGAIAVKLATGHHAVIKSGCVITVLPRGRGPINRENW